jgi:putative Holliday junction resolvase
MACCAGSGQGRVWPERGARANNHKESSVATIEPRSETKRRKRVCALDLGSARVGIAVDDELGLLAHPRGSLNAGDERALLVALRTLANEQDVARFVVGLPLDMRGNEGAAARRARRMAQRIADATGRAVELWDERLTTVQAMRALTASGLRGRRARSRVDEAAACAILQAWLDARRVG